MSNKLWILLNLAIRIYSKIIYISLKIKYFFYKLCKKKIGKYRNSDDLQLIGFIDQDGLIHVSAEYHRLFHANDLYEEGKFLIRKRTFINVLLYNEVVLVEKNFKNNFSHFYNELTVLDSLKDISRVPKIHFVDYKNNSIYINYIDGFVLREKIAKFGAKIRDIDKKTINDKVGIIEKYIDPAMVVKDIVSKDLMQKIVELVDQIHQNKILIVDIKYGNIIIKNEIPYWIDFNDSLLFKHTPKTIFNRIKKYDLILLNKIFKYVI